MKLTVKTDIEVSEDKEGKIILSTYIGGLYGTIEVSITKDQAKALVAKVNNVVQK